MDWYDEADEPDPYAGRKLVFSKETTPQAFSFLQKIANGVGETNAGMAVGWSPAKLRELMREEEFRDLIKEAKTSGIETLEEVVFRKARYGSMAALQLMLFCQAPERGWRPPQQRHSITQQTHIQVEMVAATKAAALELIEGTTDLKMLQIGGPLDIIDAEVVDD